MPIEKRIGKIKALRIGFGGYQETMIGASFDLGSAKGSWGCGDFRGFWSGERSERCKWTESDRFQSLGEAMMFIASLLAKANKTSTEQLVGVPVEATFENGRLKSWHILEEVI